MAVYYDNAENDFNSIRRFFARYVDMTMYRCIYWAVLCWVFGLDIDQLGPWQIFLFALAGLFVIVTEAVLLHFFKTTLGKFIMGIRVVSYNGNPLDLRSSIDRTRKVVFFGEGLTIPVICEVAMLICFFLNRQGRTLPWEPGSRLEIRKRPIWVMAVGLAACVAFVIAVTCALELWP